MTLPLQTPFDSIENAQQYVRMLAETIAEARAEVETDIGATSGPHAERRREALHLVQFKLEKLEQYLRGSGRVLNDPRSLRRLLLDERAMAAAVSSERPRKQRVSA